jgi:membrane protein
MQSLKDLFLLLKEAVQAWGADNASRLSAALAYYSIFSLAPLLVITISLIALVFGEDAARGQIAAQIEDLVGAQAAQTIQNAIAATAESTGRSTFTAVIGFATMLFGATTVFGELKNALNQIFGVRVRPGHAVTALVRQRLLAFSVVLGIGFLLILSLAISAVVSTLSAYMAGYLPIPPLALKAADFTISLGIMTLLFGLIFKILPNVELGWREVAAGGLVTSVLFNVGKSLIAYYLGTSSVGSAFGASGSIILILLWVFYATGIVFFGAEFVKVYVRKYGGGIRPNQYGEPASAPPAVARARARTTKAPAAAPSV